MFFWSLTGLNAVNLKIILLLPYKELVYFCLHFVLLLNLLLKMSPLFQTVCYVWLNNNKIRNIRGTALKYTKKGGVSLITLLL